MEGYVSAEKRSFFRFDVNLPYFIERLDNKGRCFQVENHQLITAPELKLIALETQQLNNLFSDSKHIQNGGVKIFEGLNHKLDFMVWLLDLILEGVDQSKLSQLDDKKEQNYQIVLPEAKESSKVFPLLNAYFIRVDEYISELIGVIEHSVRGKIFMYHQPPLKPLKLENYIKGLPELAKKGNWLAQVITLLVSKLNHYEKIIMKLKRVYENLSDYEKWPIEKVNLGEGGFAIFTSKTYVNAEKICALFRMDDEFVFAKAHCVYQSNKSNVKESIRTAFEFDEIHSEDRAHIVRFLMAQELAFHHKV